MTKQQFEQEILDFFNKKFPGRYIINDRKRKIINNAWEFYNNNMGYTTIQAYDMQVRINSKGKECILPN